jgi:hypothetical protein
MNSGVAGSAISSRLPAMFVLVPQFAATGRGGLLRPNEFLYDRAALQEYILLVSQYPHGGFIDKPTKCVITKPHEH